MMELTLIRHTSVAVAPGICYGQTDVALNDTFETEAEKVKRDLNGTVFDKVFTSPLSRCRLLADYCGFPDAEQDTRLMEMNFGDWEMQRWDEITDSRLQEWFDDYVHVCVTGGESYIQHGERIASFMAQLSQKPYRRVAIFTHGGSMLHILTALGLVRVEKAFDHQPPYGGIVRVTIPSASGTAQETKES